MLKHGLQLLAAGNDELIRAIVFLVIAALAGLGKLLMSMKTPPAREPPPADVGKDANVADEIEDFLRRSAQRRVAQKPRPAQPTQQIPPAQPQISPARPRKTERPILAEPVVEDAPKPVGGQVAEHVRKYLDTREFGRRTARLGDEVAQADEQIDQHLHQVFDHTLSRLSNAPGEAATPPTAIVPSESATATLEATGALAENLVAFLSAPDSLCQAVVLSEILHRPEERWE